jgi:lipoprotein-anchoring transpeptidase ErfK/SrfK
MIRPTGIGRWAQRALLALCLLVMSGSLALAASLSVTIDLSDQEMVVRENARIAYTWPVSTARVGYRTPVGTYQPTRLERMWYSTIYDNAPMPYSIFFHGGYAIHGTTEIGNLGQPASHGCVRLHPDHARTLFDLVLEHGRSATQITIRQ